MMYFLTPRRGGGCCLINLLTLPFRVLFGLLAGLLRLIFPRRRAHRKRF